MKRAKLVYILATGLLSALMVASAAMYVFKHEHFSATFLRLGYPTYLLYPLAAVKILGLIAIWSRQSHTLRQWAYAGFFFDFVLAGAAHLAAGDGEAAPAVGAIVLLLVSYTANKRMFAPR